MLNWLIDVSLRNRVVVVLLFCAAAAVGVVSLRYLDIDAFPDTTPVHHLYVVRHPERDRLAAHLRERNVGTGVHYPVPVHLQPAYRGRPGMPPSLPRSERAAREVLSLPMYPELSSENVKTVAAAVRSHHSDLRRASPSV